MRSALLTRLEKLENHIGGVEFTLSDGSTASIGKKRVFDAFFDACRNGSSRDARIMLTAVSAPGYFQLCELARSLAAGWVRQNGEAAPTRKKRQTV